ncbi:MAG: YbaK/EbsC family protein [Anaerolineae bacterium]|nr:His/Gly/Thr/Pro-type tRNA ligase C-terminal domain-containing protein [Anaerolineae bacterium]MDW8099137.1 YbaK/EbsC family protein [Anaerolineae bacterium]
MDLERVFGRTKREVAQQREPAGQRWLRRAGYLHARANAIPIWLPLGAITLNRLRHLCVDIVADAQPLVLSTTLMSLSGRHDALRDFVASEIRSYRQLPQRLQWDEGPTRVVFVWLEATAEDLALSTALSWQDWQAVWKRLGVDAVEIAAVPTTDGTARAWALSCPDGPDAWLACSYCGHAGEASALRPQVPPLTEEPAQPVEVVATPGCTTIQAVADFLGVPTSHMLKAVFYTTAEGQVILAVIRGDLEVDVHKLERAVGWVLHPATPAELEAVGIVAGYASPVGLPSHQGLTIIGDLSIQAPVNFVAGANRPGFHLRHVRYPRDFQTDRLADLAQARPQDPCSTCGNPLELKAGLILARLEIFSASAGGPIYLNPEGCPQPLHMAIAQLCLDRLLVAIAEVNHDDHGLIWPAILAPYDVHVVLLNTDQQAVIEAADDVARELEKNGWKLLWDRRDESAGVKFTDADLIGLPWRVTISARSLKQGGVEVKARAASTSVIVSIAHLISAFSTPERDSK